jgi:hypothetical protein
MARMCELVFSTEGFSGGLSEMGIILLPDRRYGMDCSSVNMGIVRPCVEYFLVLDSHHGVSTWAREKETLPGLARC